MNQEEMGFVEKNDEPEELLYDVGRNPEEIAKNRGLKVIYPDRDELFIDIDNDEGYT